MVVSVLISTRNREERLLPLFDALARLEIPAGMEWELLVIDNGSTDRTGEMLRLEKDKGRLPLVCLEEPLPGKSRALNLAIKRARGELVVLTDDDVEPSVGWLKAYYEAAVARPDIDGFAGKVLPLWEGDIPQWLHTEGEFAWPRGIINCRDFGNEEHLLTASVIPGGVNTALRRSVMETMGEFRTDLGPGTMVPYAEDTEYMKRLYSLGGTYLYLPDALILHRNATERMTRSYAAKWMYDAARCQIIAFKAASNAPKIFGIPRYLFNQAVRRLLSWWVEPRTLHRFKKKLHLSQTLGEIEGYRFLERHRVNSHDTKSGSARLTCKDSAP